MPKKQQQRGRHKNHPHFTRLKEICENLSKMTWFHVCLHRAWGQLDEFYCCSCGEMPGWQRPGFPGAGVQDRERKGQNLAEMSLAWKEYRTNELNKSNDGTWHLGYGVQWKREKKTCLSWFLDPVRLWVCSGSERNLFIFSAAVIN